MKGPGSTDLLVLGFTLASFLFFSYQFLETSGPQRWRRRSRRARDPLKIFVMVGQSNMEGHGYMDRIEDGKFLNGTLEWMVETDPDTYGKLKTETDDWKERTDVWIAYNRQNLPNVRPEMNSVGPLAAGYGGSEGGQGHEIGPELGFGWTVGDELGSSSSSPPDRRGGNSKRNGKHNKHKKHEYGNDDDGDGDDEADVDIFLIKVAWGGRSLAVNYRPPSSGGETGLYYEAMLADVYRTIVHLPEMVPGYTFDRGYSIEGFAWHQGWNDGCDKNMTAEYESNLANLIRDVRTDLGVPDLPFVVGVSGMSGWYPRDPKRTEIATAQLAVADASRYPEFAGTVASVETRDFFREPKPVSPGDQGYHWNNNCESYWLIGQAMGKAMVGLVRRKNDDHKVPTTATATTRRRSTTTPSDDREDDRVGWVETMLRGMDVFDTTMD